METKKESKQNTFLNFQENDWEDFAPGILSTEANFEMLTDKKNAVFISDVLKKRVTENLEDYSI